MTFAPPTKKSCPLTCLIFGPTGSGKTQGALTLARGLVGPKGRIGVICTEPKGINWQIGKTPFDVLTMDRYDTRGKGGFNMETLIAHVAEASDAGYDCCIIDSLSDFWDGPGGLQDVKDELDVQKPKGGFSNWRAITELCDRLNEALVYRCGMHVIVTAFAREKMKEVYDEATRKNIIVDLGVQPRLRQHMMERLDIIIELQEDTHKARFWKNRIGAPDITGPITEDTGRALAAYGSSSTGQQAKEIALTTDPITVTITAGKDDAALLGWIGVASNEVLLFDKPGAPFALPCTITARIKPRGTPPHVTVSGRKLPLYDVVEWKVVE